MKKQIRVGVFESNSSSTHSLTIVSEDEFKKWKNGEVVFNRWQETFVENKEPSFTEDDVIDFYDDIKERFWKSWDQLSGSEKQEFVNRYKDEVLDDEDEEFMSYDRYMNYYNDYLDTYVKYFTSPSGDKMVAFGYYGHD